MSCAKCIHQRVCKIYEESVRFNESLSRGGFAPHTMNEVCGQFSKSEVRNE